LLGYNVEYSSVAFALFFIGEYLHIVFASTFTVVCFFGGWQPPTGTFERAFLFILTPSIVYPLDFLIHLPHSLETYPSFAYVWLMLIDFFDWIIPLLFLLKIMILSVVLKISVVMQHILMTYLDFAHQYHLNKRYIFSIIGVTFAVTNQILFFLTPKLLFILFHIMTVKFCLRLIFVFWVYLMLLKYKEQRMLHLSNMNKWVQSIILTFLVGFTLMLV